MSAEDKAKELGLELGNASAPAGNYVPAVRTGDLLFISGQLPVRPDGSRPTGKLGDDIGIEAAYEAARLCAISLLSHARNELGSLDKIKRIVRVAGYVNATPDFTQQAQVVNGASDLLASVFGDAGKHARVAIGVASLPAGVPVEVEMTVEVE